MTIKSYYKILHVLDDVGSRDLTADEFQLSNLAQDRIQELELVHLGEMHPHHTGTISPATFAGLDKNNL